MASQPFFAVVDYEDSYVQPLLLSVIQKKVSSHLLKLVSDIAELPPQTTRLLQWRQYESIDFDHLMANAETSLANSYIIRKALIRKHFLSATVSHWLTKHPTSTIKEHVQPSVEFEVDYAEFLDDALIEAFELKESWARNDELSADADSKEWWILKPGMSERGQGIRLFSSEAELQEIFEEWDPPSDDDDDDEVTSADIPVGETRPSADESGNGIMTSHLRHFVAQPYISSPLLLPAPHPSAGRKFHVRTYVVAVGALKLYVYRPMLALFAAQPYAHPSATEAPNEELSSHLTNTCLQSGEREGSVHAFWSLPSTVPGTSTEQWRESVFRQICTVTGEVFEAAARSMSIHFQPLPNAFELFGLDFLVDAQGNAWLLEVNAFPDFAQTGEELQSLIRDLLSDVTDVAIKPFLGLSTGPGDRDEDRMVEVLNIDLGRR